MYKLTISYELRDGAQDRVVTDLVRETLAGEGGVLASPSEEVLAGSGAAGRRLVFTFTERPDTEKIAEVTGALLWEKREQLPNDFKLTGDVVKITAPRYTPRRRVRWPG